MTWQALLVETQLIARALDGIINPAPVRRSAVTRILAGLAASLAFASAAVLAAGAYLWLEETHSTRESLLYLGGGVALAALILAGTSFVVAHRRTIRLGIKAKKLEHKVKNLMEAASEELGEPARRYPKTAAAAAAIIGIVLGEKIGKRGLQRFVDGIAHPIDGVKRIERRFMH